MADRMEKGFRLLCLVLAGIVVFQLSRLMWRRDPLARLQVPSAPQWEPPVPVTNAPPTSLPGSNTTAMGKSVATNATATPSGGSTNLVAVTNASAASQALMGTNRAPDTNVTLSVSPGTNAPSATAVPRPPGAPPSVGGMPPGFPGRRGGPGGGAPSKPLPPLLQSRVDKIIQSEVLAPIQRPPPMALLGIAGRDAFLRTPSGQTQLLREGAEADGIRLLRIGTNRVLIEQAGQKVELTIFAGFGGESLLPK